MAMVLHELFVPKFAQSPSIYSGLVGLNVELEMGHTNWHERPWGETYLNHRYCSWRQKYLRIFIFIYSDDADVFRLSYKTDKEIYTNQWDCVFLPILWCPLTFNSCVCLYNHAYNCIVISIIYAYRQKNSFSQIHMRFHKISVATSDAGLGGVWILIRVANWQM